MTYFFSEFRQLWSLLLASEELHTDAARPRISPLLVMWGDRLGTSGTLHQRDCLAAHRPGLSSRCVCYTFLFPVHSTMLQLSLLKMSELQSRPEVQIQMFLSIFT